MRNAHRLNSSRVCRCGRFLLTTITAVVAMASACSAQNMSIEELVSAVVHIKTFINPEGRTVQVLGREREGSGIIIDATGLVLTIGYLIVEAHAAEVSSNDGRTIPAEIVGYDHETGFGLLRTIAPLKVRPMALGKSAEISQGDRVLIASYGGPEKVAPAHVVARREFAGNWEYLLDEAIFTSPPHPAWSGAALIGREGKLLGIGSLIVSDATGKGDGVSGNMFVPIDRLPPILADLISDGHVVGAKRPWLGVNTDEIGGHLVVSRVTPDGPADKAGARHGDIIIGVDGEAVKSLADFYRKVWAFGSAGTVIPLDLLKDSEKRRLNVKSMNRLDHLKLKSTF
jgi:S1-C subfamily serine protease